MIWLVGIIYFAKQLEVLLTLFRSFVTIFCKKSLASFPLTKITPLSFKKKIFDLFPYFKFILVYYI